MYLHGVKTLFVQYLHEILSKLSTNSRKTIFWQQGGKTTCLILTNYVKGPC